MSYLVSKIIFCLLAALLFGFVLSFFLWRSIAQKKERDLTGLWERRFGDLERDRDTRIAKLRREVEDHREQIPTLEASLAERSDLISRLESDLTDWRGKVPAMEERLSEREKEMAELRREANDYTEKLAAIDKQVGERDTELASLRKDANVHAQKIAANNAALADSQRAMEAAKGELSQNRARHEKLVAEHASLQRELAAAKQTVTDSQQSHSSGEEALAAARARIEQQQQAIKKLESDALGLREVGTERAREVSALREGVEQREVALSATREEVERATKALSDAQNEVRTLRGALAPLEQQVDNGERQVAALEVTLARDRAGREREADDAQRLTQQVTELERQLATCNESQSAAQRTLTQRERRIARLEHDLAAVSQAPQRVAPEAVTRKSPARERPAFLLDRAPVASERDDLKKIKGVGPVLEKTMNELGIYKFAQVGSLDADEIRWVTEHINTFPDRIRRDKWVQQAKRLHNEKYGEKL